MSARGDGATGWQRAYLAGLAAIWLFVFFHPMEQLSIVVNAGTFIMVFVGLSLAQLTLWRWFRAAMAVLVSEGYMVYYYGLSHDAFAPPGAWVQSAVTINRQELAQMNALLRGQLALTDPLQTHLFLFCVCGLYWLVVYACRKRWLWVLYNLLALVALAAIDGNTPVRPNQALVVVLTLFLTHLAWLQYHRLKAAATSFRIANTARFATPVAAVLSLSLTVGWALPKADAVWEDPTQSLRQWGGTGKGGDGPAQTIGYQENNQHLGGSFISNDTPVLSVVTNYPTYLRGQVYDYYTGKGWETGYVHQVPVNAGDTFAAYSPPPAHVSGRLVEQKITVLPGSGLHASVLFGGYALQRVSGIQLPLNAALALGQESDTVSAPGNPTTYTVTSYELTNPEAVLSHLPPLSSPRAQAFPEDIRDTYTQLPELPDRVFKLANQLAGQSVDEYQIVENVLTYLQTHYPYETEDIPRPGANQDYVDQFLFDSRRGYCNNFSSAMAVLLRCVGIPTRWVTGFATGDIDASYSGPGQRYIYRNADAHSWVEVYFPNVGWIPFDPTPTFTFPFLPASTSDKPVPVTPPSPSVNTTNPKPVVKPTPAPKDSTVAASSSVNRGRIGRWILDGVAGILAAAVLMLLALRRPVRVWWVQRMWRQPAAALLTPAMRRLTRLLQRAGLAEPASTLRDLEVAARQHGIAPDDYRQLVTTTEAHWYGGKPIPPQEIERTHRTWLAWVRAALVHPQQRSQRTARKKDSVDETMDET